MLKTIKNAPASARDWLGKQAIIQTVFAVTKKGWRLFLSHPFFEKVFLSKWSFITLIIGLCLITFSLTVLFVGLSDLILKEETGVGLLSRSIDTLWTLFNLSWSFATFFALFCAVYLTTSGNWYRFRQWWVFGRALRRDRKKSVTDNILVARKRLQYYAEDDGTFLTFAPRRRVLSLRQRKLTYVDDRHVTVIGGTRGGKGVSVIIPNLLHHKGSAIIYDPAGENFDITGAFRQQILGQTVHILDPFGITGQPSACWNPLLDIDFDKDPQALDKCFALAESLIEYTGGDRFWSESAQELLAMTCAYVGVRSIKENMHLPQVYRLLQSENLDALWTAMSHCREMDGAISGFGDACLSRKKEFSGVIQTLRTSLRFLNTATMKTNLTQSSFSMSDLKNGKTTIYVVVPAGAGTTYKGWLRLLFDGAFNAMQDMSIPKPAEPTLFMIDEFPLLGYMERMKRAAGEAAKFGVKLFLCAQDINQLKEIYGEPWETFIGNSGLTIFFANNDLTTQKYLSEKLGQEYYTKVTSSSSSSTSAQGGGSSTSTSSSQELRAIARPNEIMRQTSRASGDAFFLIPDMKPMRLPKSPYYLWDMIPEGLVFKTDETLHLEENVSHDTVEAPTDTEAVEVAQ